MYLLCSWIFAPFQVREIQQEKYVEQETDQQNEAKQTAAIDLSKRLKDFRSLNDAASLKGNWIRLLLSLNIVASDAFWYNKLILNVGFF